MLTGLGTLLLLLGYVPAQAQEFYPVVARFTQLPPYPVYLADFSNPSQTNLSVQVQQNDRSIATRPFRIRIYIEGQGFQIQSTDLVQGEPPLTLSFGQVYNLPADQVANYFKQYNLKVSAAQYARPFSEGAFRFGVEIIDYATNRPVSGIQWANPVWITINEPPVWIMPQNALTMVPALPQNIVFQWSPRHTNVSDVEYEFTITDLMINSGFAGNVQNLFLAQPAYYKTRTRATTLVYDPTMPPLVPGRTYAYRVEAIAKRGREDVGVFRNNGFSEIQYFNYGTPLLPPSNLRLTWNETTGTRADLNWKGETNHQSFVVQVRERGGNKPWRNVTVNPQATGLYNNFAFNGLDPAKAYETQVVGTGADGQRATSVVAPLEGAPAQLKQPDFSIKGKVVWAYNTTEETFSDPGRPTTTTVATRSNFFWRAPSEASAAPRQQNRQPLTQKEPASRRFALKEAIISLYNTGDAVVDAATFAQQRGQYQLVQTVSSNADGEYEFSGANLKLLRNARNLYFHARFKNDAFGEATTTMRLPDNPEGTLKAGELVLTASTFRYTPRLKFGGFAGAIMEGQVQNVSLYRLKSVVEANPYLLREGNAADRTEVQYNGDIYVKVADFSNDKTRAQLFTNHLFNDQLVLGVGTADGDVQFYPVSGVEAAQVGNSLTVTDEFVYQRLPPKISGFVSQGMPAVPVPDVTVLVQGEPFKTDKRGYYEAPIPTNILNGQSITLSATDPLDQTSRVVPEVPLTFAGRAITQNLLFSTKARQFTGQVLDDKRPVAAAVVSLGKLSVKTSETGHFLLVLDELTLLDHVKRTDSVKIMADGYTPVRIALGDFNSAPVTGMGSENQRSWATELAKINNNGVTPDTETYKRLFAAAGQRCSGVSHKADIGLVPIYKKYRVLVYKASTKRNRLGLRNLADSVGTKEYLDLPLTINEQAVTVSAKTGYSNQTTGKVLVIAYKNPEQATALYIPKSFTVTLPEKSHRRDTVYTFLVRLMPAQYIGGMVLDSTLFVEGMNIDTDSLVKPGPNLLNRLNTIAGTKVENEGIGEAETDAKGVFRILVESGKENTLKLSRETRTIYRIIPKDSKLVKDTLVLTYNDGQMSVSEKDIETFAADDTTKFQTAISGSIDRTKFARGFLFRRDPRIPNFTKLLGFNAKIEKAVRNSGAGGDTYKISGQLLLHDWAKATKDSITIRQFTVADKKDLILTFKDIIVTPDKDAKLKYNAVPVRTEINLVDTEFDALLFGYAPVKVEGNPAGEPFIRLQQIPGKPGQGKIGGSSFQLTQTKLFGFDFGKMELTRKAVDKKESFGKFNTTDAIDIKDAEDAKKKGKKDKKDKKKDDKKKVIAKEPFMVAFATQNLEELKDDVEYELEFITGDSKRQSGNAADGVAAANTKATTAETAAATTKTASNAAVADMANTKSSLTRTVKQSGLMSALNTAAKAEATATTARTQADAVAKDASKVELDANYVKFPLGNAPIVGKVSAGTLSGLYINIERSSAILKKSGLNMKGALTLPQIPFMAADKFKLLIDKIDVGKDFLLKQATFVRDEKKNIHELVAGGFLMEWKSVQILNDFKGYAIGGRISTDKDNYVEINSLGLSVVDGRFYPSMELALPESGLRMGNIKFAQSGKKLLSIKSNIADKSYELEAAFKIEYDDSARETAVTDSTDKFGRKLSDDDKVARNAKALADKAAQDDKAARNAKALADKAAQTAQPVNADVAAPKTTDATKSGGWASKIFPLELQKFVWSTTGKFLVSAKPRPLTVSFFTLNIRRFIFTRAGTKPDGKPDAVKKSELNDLLAMTDEEMTKANETGRFNNDNTQIKKDSLGKENALDSDGKRVRTGVFDKNEQFARSNTGSDKLTVKEQADKILEKDPDVSMAFGFAGGIELTDSDVKGLKFDSDVSLLYGNFGKGWEVSMNEVMLKLESAAFKAYGKVKYVNDAKKSGFEGTIDLETVKKRFAASFKYYKLPNGIELGAGLQVSATVPMGPITWISLGGGFDLNTADQKYKVYFIGSATPTLTVAEPKLCLYKDIKVQVEFDGKACGYTPVIKGSAEKWVKEEKLCGVQVELDFCRTRLIAKLNCEIEVSQETKADINALVIADAKLGIFVGANVRVNALGGIANGIFGLPIVFKTTAGPADGMPPELAVYMNKIPAYLIGSDNTTATGTFLKMDVAREFRWSDRVSVAGLNLVEANVEAVLRSEVDMGVNFRNGNFRVLGRASFDAEGRVSVLSFALNGKLGLGLMLDGGYRNDIGWNFAAQARGDLQVWRDNSGHLQCNDYQFEREWYEEEECAERNWRFQCIRRHRVWKLSIFPTTKVKVCVGGSFGGAYQARGGNSGWRLLK